MGVGEQLADRIRGELPPVLEAGRGVRVELLAISSRADVLLLCEGNVLKYGHARRADDAEGLLALSFGARADDADAAARGGVPAGERLAALAFNARGDACVVRGAAWLGVVQLPCALARL